MKDSGVKEVLVIGAIGVGFYLLANIAKSLQSISKTTDTINNITDTIGSSVEQGIKDLWGGIWSSIKGASSTDSVSQSPTN